MEPAPQASKTPQQSWLVQAAPLEQLRNDLAQLCIAKKVGMHKASRAVYVIKGTNFLSSEYIPEIISDGVSCRKHIYTRGTLPFANCHGAHAFWSHATAC